MYDYLTGDALLEFRAYLGTKDEWLLVSGRKTLNRLETVLPENEFYKIRIFLTALVRDYELPANRATQTIAVNMYSLSLEGDVQKSKYKSWVDAEIDLTKKHMQVQEKIEFFENLKYAFETWQEYVGQSSRELFLKKNKERFQQALTDEQISLAKLIHEHVERIEQAGGGDEMLLVTLYDYMDPFKQLMDTATQAQMDLLANQYPGFHRFAALLETIAEALADGRITPPKDH